MEYLSERGHPLVYHGPAPKKPVLTVENYLKWYDIYIVQIDGLLSVAPYTELPGTLHTWCDHVPHPEFCIALARHLGCDWDEQSFEMIVGRYVIEIQGQYADFDA